MAKNNVTNIVNNIKELNLEIDYDKLADSIVEAQKKAEKAAELEKAEKNKQLRARIGYKDYSYIKNGFVRNLRVFLNRVKVYLKILFARKNIAKDLDTSHAFIQTLSVLFVGTAQFVLYLSSIVFMITAFYHPGQTFGFKEIALSVFLSISSFIFAQIFRLIKIQIDNLKDRDYLFVIFGAICAVIPGIVPIITFIINIGGKT